MKRMQTTLNISYDRLTLIEKLETAKAEAIKKDAEFQKRLKQGAIRATKATLAAIKSGNGSVSVYVNEEGLQGTYYQPARTYYSSLSRNRLDLVLKQLKLSDSKKIRLGQNDSEWVLQFIDIPE